MCVLSDFPRHYVDTELPESSSTCLLTISGMPNPAHHKHQRRRNSIRDRKSFRLALCGEESEADHFAILLNALS